MKAIFGIALVLAAPSSPAFAETMSIVSTPPIGSENTVAAGESIYSFIRTYTIDAYQIDADTKAGPWLAEELVRTGTKVIPVTTTKAAKACVPEEGTINAKGPCFIDDNGDGLFDRHSGDEVQLFRKLKAPVPYSKATITVASSDSFKRVVLYQGATTDTIRFSYREFSNDMARPAFTEELSIPREGLPAMIVVKNLQLEVLQISGMGLTYRMVKAN